MVTDEPPAATAATRPKYEVHPAAELFPTMTDEELQGLVADIKANGQHEPATLWCGKLIDGRNRAKACEQLGIDLQCCELDPDTDPIKWVLSYNLHRRHLSESQRAMVAARLKEFYAAEAKERQKRKPVDSVSDNCPEQNGRASDQAGDALNVSGKSVERAATVIAHGSPELIAAVERGDVAVSKAAEVVKTTPKADQLKKVNWRKLRGKPAKAKPAKITTPTAKIDTITPTGDCPRGGNHQWVWDGDDPTDEFCSMCKDPRDAAPAAKEPAKITCPKCGDTDLIIPGKGRFSTALCMNCEAGDSTPLIVDTKPGQPDEHLSDLMLETQEILRKLVAKFPAKYREALGNRLISAGEELKERGDLR